MKKKILILLSLLTLSLTACSNNTTQIDATSSDSSWIVEDFYVYNDIGEITNYPDNEELRFYDNVKGLESSYEKNGETNLTCYTKRGVSVHCSAKMAFSEYDLSGFYHTLTKWPTLGSLNESEKAIENNFFEKYPDLNEAIKHTNDISGDLALFISATFQVDNDGNVTQLELNEKGNPIERDPSKDTYHMVFYIRNDNVFQWGIEHSSGLQDINP